MVPYYHIAFSTLFSLRCPVLSKAERVSLESREGVVERNCAERLVIKFRPETRLSGSRNFLHDPPSYLFAFNTPTGRGGAKGWKLRRDQAGKLTRDCNFHRCNRWGTSRDIKRKADKSLNYNGGGERRGWNAIRSYGETKKEEIEMKDFLRECRKNIENANLTYELIKIRSRRWNF